MSLTSPTRPTGSASGSESYIAERSCSHVAPQVAAHHARPNGVDAKRGELDGQGARERAQRAADSRRDRPAETFVYLITNGYSSGTIVTVDGGSVLV